MSHASPAPPVRPESSDSPRVLVLTADYEPAPWSGIGRSVARSARALHRQGLAVTVLVAEAEGRPRPAVDPSALPGGPAVLPLDRRRFDLDPRGFDVVHVHSLRLAELALELKRRFTLPLVYTVHTRVGAELVAGRMDRPELGCWIRWQKRLFEGADRLVFPSEAERRAVIDRFPGLRRRTAVVHPGIGLEPNRARPSASAGPAVFAGRFQHAKGLDLLEALVPWLAGRGTRVVLAGGHGDARGHALAARLAEIRGVELPGWLSLQALHALFERASLVLVPSRYEPFGLVALEAMAAGAPVLASDVGGLAEVVPRASRIRTRRPAVWRRRIARLLRDPAAARRLARRGRRRAIERFDPETTGRLLAREIRRVVVA